jgi:Methane oxygenase PmoA
MRRALSICVVLLASSTTPAADEVSIRVDDRTVIFQLGDEVVTKYETASKYAKPFFWPVYAAPGVAVTRPWPMVANKGKEEATDHKHQKSLWFTHGDIIPEGVTLKTRRKGVEGVDFWSEEPGHGTITCTSIGKPQLNGKHAWIVTKNEWKSADGDHILDESRTLHLHAVEHGRLLVVESDLVASAVPLTFGDTKEGAFGVRVRETLRGDKGGKLTNAEGKSGEGKLNNVAKTGVWGLKSAWCDDSGPVDGKTAGIAVFADPDNSIPTYWHARDYGLLAANPFGGKKSGFPDARERKELLKLAKGEHLKLRYGVYLHLGDVKEGKVAEAFEQFVKLGK